MKKATAVFGLALAAAMTISMVGTSEAQQSKVPTYNLGGYTSRSFQVPVVSPKPDPGYYGMGNDYGTHMEYRDDNPNRNYPQSPPRIPEFGSHFPKNELPPGMVFVNPYNTHGLRGQIDRLKLLNEQKGGEEQEEMQFPTKPTVFFTDGSGKPDNGGGEDVSDDKEEATNEEDDELYYDDELYDDYYDDHGDLEDQEEYKGFFWISQACLYLRSKVPPERRGRDYDLDKDIWKGLMNHPRGGEIFANLFETDPEKLGKEEGKWKAHCEELIRAEEAFEKEMEKVINDLREKTADATGTEEPKKVDGAGNDNASDDSDNSGEDGKGGNNTNEAKAGQETDSKKSGG